ncbi:MAG: glycosyl transferase, group 1, partial [Ilumatobacteraceae bacterium]|nr:glycosyl transferase, group 1 [Ilumatobacteraceae bacterium]
IDVGTEVPRILAESGGGVAVRPDDPAAFISALRAMVDAPADAAAMGVRGRAWVETAASPRAVAVAYVNLFRELLGGGPS